MKYRSKYLSIFLFVTLLLTGCSGGESPISASNLPPESTSDSTESPAQDTASSDTEDPAAVISDADDIDAENSDAEDSEKEDDTNDTAGVEQKNVKLEIDSQKTAGQIVVKKVATSRDGWVSIHKSREDGSIVLPESIGEARVDSGDSEDIVVDLWEAPYIDEKLWVLLHIDGGERGTYEFPEKDVPVRKNGEIMARSFKVEGEAEEKKEDE
ncbi:MAG: hypothetical protein AAFV90_05430 [Cyanobacteria bacterium J06634_5]